MLEIRRRRGPRMLDSLEDVCDEDLAIAVFRYSRVRWDRWTDEVVQRAV